jgi:PAS domain S-box-containing protein
MTVDIDEGKKAEEQPGFVAQLQATLNVIPAYAWYAAPSGGLTFVNKRTADFLGLPKDHPLRFGIDIGAQWDAHIPLLHPDDQEESRKAWATCLRTGEGAEFSQRVRNAQGDYRWFLSRAEPLRASDGTLLNWVGVNLDIEELKRAEEGSRTSEYKLRQIIEAAPGHLWSADPAGEPTQFSQRALDYYGVQLEDFKHGGWEAYVHPDDYPETARAYYHAIQTGTSFQSVLRLRRADGEFRWHDVRGEPLRDQQGRIVQWYGVSVDIDEARKAEDRLRRSEAYLAETQRLSHTGSAAYNETDILYFSDETYRILGFDPREGLPSREAARERIHPGDRERVREEARKALEQKKEYKREYRISLAGGIIKYIETIGVPKFSPRGELVEVVSTVIDVTERKRAEQALRESEARARSAIDGIAGLVSIHAPNGEVETVNRQCLEYFGRSLEWLKNWGTNDAVHPEDLPQVVEMFTRAIAAGIPFHIDQRLRRFDGEYRWFDNRGVPIRDDSGRIVRWYVLITDIEDRTQALARLEQMRSDFAHMNRVSVMGELAAELSHEITQPIASARNNARAARNFLDMQPPNLGEAREALSAVVGDTDRAGYIVDRIRAHMKKAPPRKGHFDLNEAINEIILLGRSAAIRNGVSIQTGLSEGLCPVHGERVQLQQVVLNLLLNAVEAMGSVEAGPRELLISTEQDHRGVLVAVRDSGPGIDPSHLERVFDTFYTTKPSGMGMGLSICRSIIEAHGGRLWAEANEPRGAVFQFILPNVADQTAQAHGK